MQEKGQAAIELIIIAGVLVAMLLAVVVVMVRQNAETNRLYAIQRDTAQCQRISAMISSFSLGKGYSETLLFGLEKPVHIENGSVLIGSIGCRYSGTAKKQTEASQFTPDSQGFDLYNGGAAIVGPYKAKGFGQEVVFCNVQETDWC